MLECVRHIHGLGMETGKRESMVSKGRWHRHKKRAQLCWEAKASTDNGWNRASVCVSLPLFFHGSILADLEIPSVPFFVPVASWIHCRMTVVGLMFATLIWTHREKFLVSSPFFSSPQKGFRNPCRVEVSLYLRSLLGKHGRFYMSAVYLLEHFADVICKGMRIVLG